VLWAYAALVALAGAFPVVLSMTGNRSAGALDNASGVAAVIAAARDLGDVPDVGVLITDAEELGLAGAQAWAESRPRGVVLNCDGVDDGGINVVMYTRPRPDGVLRATARASRVTGVAHESMRLIPGILADSVAFSAAGMPAVTFSRGTWWSLARVHSKRDDLAHLRGDGIDVTARLMAATARELLSERDGGGEST
jgi:Zn-dependent M28 family amino/carboxypeptidase